MNIKGTTPNIATQAAPKGAPKEKTTITISMPEVDADKFVASGWNVVDSIGAGVAKTGIASFAGIYSAIPVLGLGFSQDIRGEVSSGKTKANTVSQIANLGVSFAQIGGLGLAGLSALSGITGVGPAGALLKAAGASFAGAGLAGVVMGYALPK